MKKKTKEQAETQESAARKTKGGGQRQAPENVPGQAQQKPKKRRMSKIKAEAVCDYATNEIKKLMERMGLDKKDLQYCITTRAEGGAQYFNISNYSNILVHCVQAMVWEAIRDFLNGDLDLYEKEGE